MNEKWVPIAIEMFILDYTILHFTYNISYASLVHLANESFNINESHRIAASFHCIFSNWKYRQLVQKARQRYSHHFKIYVNFGIDREHLVFEIWSSHCRYYRRFNYSLLQIYIPAKDMPDTFDRFKLANISKITENQE